MSEIICYHAILASLLILLGGGMLFPQSKPLLKAFPRHKLTGWILTVIAWGWTTLTLMVHPIDFLAGVQDYIPYIGIICIPLSWYALSNLLTCRALGAILMLYPMPLILVTRDQVTAWRLVSISFSYLCLTFGMFIVFYPWILRKICTLLSDNNKARFATGASGLLIGLLILIAMTQFGKVIGQ